jgi:hypothetical protein
MLLTSFLILIMWNDTYTPLAYFISFRTYGTWLHGDKRGSIDRFQNRYRSPYIRPNGKWQKYNEQRLKAKPLILEARQHRSIEAAIRETCNIRKWWLAAINVRTNHVHTVVSASQKKPELGLNALRQTQPGSCGKMVYGLMRSARGQTKVAKGGYGTNEVLKKQSTM